MKFIKSILALSVLTAISVQANAASTQGNFLADATIQSTCTIAATDMPFGAFAPAAGSLTVLTSSEISTVCSNGVAYTLELNGGASNDVNLRKMVGVAAGNTDQLSYNIYKDPGNQSLFGESLNGIAKVGTGASQVTTIYGRLPTNQFITPDNYIDNLTVTLTY